MIRQRIQLHRAQQMKSTKHVLFVLKLSTFSPLANAIIQCAMNVQQVCISSQVDWLTRSENNFFPLSFLATGMRVLCKQNECPICRRINQKVIFTSEILPYRELDQKNRSGLYDKTFRISFSGQRTQNAFQRLLEHRCNK